MARRRKAQMELEVAAPEGAAAAAQVLEAPLLHAQELKPVTAWTVARTGRVSLSGQLTTLAAGTRVTLAEYGPAGIRSLQAQLELSPVV